MEEIINRLNAEAEYRKSLTEAELKDQYQKMEIAGFPLDLQIKFASDIGGSNQISYHYELICMEWIQERTTPLINLSKYFGKHGVAGLDFLYSRLKEADSENMQVSIAYLSAQILNSFKNKEFYETYCNQLLPFLLACTRNPDETVRRKALIALGWVGTEKQINIFIQHILADNDSLCRAWASSGLMQMSFHRVDRNIICERVRPVFAKALAEESDLFACGVMLVSAQTLFEKKWISNSATENKDKEKIEKARKSAIRYFEK